MRRSRKSLGVVRLLERPSTEVHGDPRECAGLGARWRITGEQNPLPVVVQRDIAQLAEDQGGATAVSSCRVAENGI